MQIAAFLPCPHTTETEREPDRQTERENRRGEKGREREREGAHTRVSLHIRAVILSDQGPTP